MASDIQGIKFLPPPLGAFLDARSLPGAGAPGSMVIEVDPPLLKAVDMPPPPSAREIVEGRSTTCPTWLITIVREQWHGGGLIGGYLARKKRLSVPPGPGLGLDPDMEVLNRYRLGPPVVIES